MKALTLAIMLGVWTIVGATVLGVSVLGAVAVMLGGFLIGLCAAAYQHMPAPDPQYPLPARLDNIDGRSVILEWELGRLTDDQFVAEIDQILLRQRQQRRRAQ